MASVAEKRSGQNDGSRPRLGTGMESSTMPTTPMSRSGGKRRLLGVKIRILCLVEI